MIALPDKLSELIELAIHDLQAVEKDRRYVVNMCYWHMPMDGVCEVCLAGAVMAGTLGVSPLSLVDDPCAEFTESVSRKLLALEAVRKGMVIDALSFLRKPGRMPVAALWVDPPTYSCDRDGFFAALRGIAETLRKEGL